MEIEIKKYVLEQLNGQCIRRKRIDVLEFELETLMSQADEKAREVIEAMAFSHGDGEHVQTSDISDITADIAMSYRSAITDQARELYAWISAVLPCGGQAYRARTGGRLPLLFHPATRGHRHLPEAAGYGNVMKFYIRLYFISRFFPNVDCGDPLDKTALSDYTVYV